MSEIDQQFVEYIIKSIVGNPGEVKIERSVDERGVLLELSVDPEDLGRVIGKRGATAQSLRTLLRALGTKNDARYNLKIIDTGPPPTPVSDDQTSNDSTSSDDDFSNSQPVEDVSVETPAEDPAGEPEEEPQTQTTAEETPAVVAEDDLASKTRRELAELDDLDV